MFSTRSRSGSSLISNAARRKHKSRLNVEASRPAPPSRFVAAMTRNKLPRDYALPTGATSCCSNTRSSLTCTPGGMSLASSKNTVAPSASSNSPCRDPSAAAAASEHSPCAEKSTPISHLMVPRQPLQSIASVHLRGRLGSPRRWRAPPEARQSRGNLPGRFFPAAPAGFRRVN